MNLMIIGAFLIFCAFFWSKLFLCICNQEATALQKYFMIRHQTQLKHLLLL